MAIAFERFLMTRRDLAAIISAGARRHGVATRPWRAPHRHSKLCLDRASATEPYSGRPTSA